MDNNVNLIKTSIQLKDVIDREFKELSSQKFTEENNVETVEEFFILYDKLFYTIPKEGDSNSHEYLSKRSSEYIDIELINEEIQELISEVTKLREENLQLKLNKK